MKNIMTVALLTPVLFVQLAVATWGNGRSFSCPANTNNECTDQQKAGFDWKNASVGVITEYDQVSLSGYTCADTFRPGPPGRKRSVQVRSDFNQRCVQAKATRDDSTPPKIWCGGDNQMSITSMHVSVEVDTILVFYFNMPDGTVCKKSQKCKATGTVVENDQCGGATAVWVRVHKTVTYDCEYGIHKINFDCNPPEGSKPPTTTSTHLTTTTGTTTYHTVTTTTRGTTHTEKTTEKTTDRTTEKTTDRTTEKTTDRTTETTTAETTRSTSQRTTRTATLNTTIATTSKTTTRRTSTTSITTTTTTTTTATTTDTTTDTISTDIATTATTIVPPPSSTTTTTIGSCSRCSRPPTTTPTSGSSVPPTDTISTSITLTTLVYTHIPSSTTSTTSPPTDVPCPDVLPQCLNTWMSKAPKCQSNSEISCLCPEIEYIAKVQECLSAWAGNDNDLQGGYSYLAGICAKYVSENPGICTGVPSDVTLVPYPTPGPQVIISTVGTVIQTITMTMSVPVTPPPPEQCTTITWTATDHSGVMSTGVVTVPQVVFVTASATTVITVDSNGQPLTTSGGESVGLVPFVPASTTSSSETTSSPTGFGPFNGTSGPPVRTGDLVGNFTGSGVTIDANLGLAGLFAVAALLL